MQTETVEVTENKGVIQRLDDIERKIDECLAVHKYVMEQIGPMLEALSSSPMAKMFFG